jgi:hypothetical protein
MKREVVLVMIVLLVFTMAIPAWGSGRKLADSELDQVTAGNFNVQAADGAWKFAFDTSNGVTGNGTLNSSSAPLSIAANSAVVNQSSISLSGNAQQNLNSLINVTASNSIVNVLLNLNINLPNSIVGSITQVNQLQGQGNKP